MFLYQMLRIIIIIITCAVTNNQSFLLYKLFVTFLHLYQYFVEKIKDHKHSLPHPLATHHPTCLDSLIHFGAV